MIYIHWITFTQREESVERIVWKWYSPYLLAKRFQISDLCLLSSLKHFDRFTEIR